LETEYGEEEEVLDAESSWRSEKWVSVKQMGEPWTDSLARLMHVATKSAEGTEGEEGKQEGKYGKVVQSQGTPLL
jgi:hypothetical protein